eukprot:1161364-Pelagomonas_calceolata.AAC.1
MFFATLPDSGYEFTLYESYRLFSPIVLLQSVISVILMTYKMENMCCSEVPIPRLAVKRLKRGLFSLVTLVRRRRKKETIKCELITLRKQAAQLVRGGMALSARDMAVPLDCGRDVEALLRQGTQNNWMPEPDTVAVHSEEEMQGLVAKQIGKMNG